MNLVEILDELGFSYDLDIGVGGEICGAILSFDNRNVEYMAKELQLLAEYWNGMFTITGGEPGDIWQLKMRDGVFSRRSSTVVWDADFEEYSKGDFKAIFG